MAHNPFTGLCAALQQEMQSVENERYECLRQLAWHAAFSLDTEAGALAANKREAAQIRVTVEGLKKDRTILAVIEVQLSQSAKLDLDPRSWFSAERFRHAKQRDSTRERLAQLDKHIFDQEIETESVLQACKQLQEQLDKHRTIDTLELKAKSNALALHLDKQRPKLEKLVAEKQRVADLLKAPMLELSDLKIRLARLESDIAKADIFDQRLSSAQNSYEKAKIHEECCRTFDGDGKPGQIKQKKLRELQPIRRNLEKVEARLIRIGQLASRTISTLVIDGNNLCYEGRDFIGLEPLYAVTYALADNYRVIVVFDASIRHLMRMSDLLIAHGFPREVRVHVVASRQAADQTVLETASAADAYVISNDRFRDFTDKSAVSDHRLIRHEIVAGRVFVHDLNLTVEFKNEGHASEVQPAM